MKVTLELFEFNRDIKDTYYDFEEENHEAIKQYMYSHHKQPTYSVSVDEIVEIMMECYKYAVHPNNQLE